MKKKIIVGVALLGMLSGPAFAKDAPAKAKQHGGTVVERCANPALAKKKGLDCKVTGTAKREAVPTKPRLGFEFNPWGFASF